MNKLQLIDADTLYYKPLAHPKMLIDGVLSDGLAILAGDSKIGKSWMVLWLCLQISKGEPVWGIPTRKTDVVYLALEDREWRIQQRMQELTEAPPENLHFGFSCGQLGSELESQIEAVLQDYPSTGLIFIDTLQMIRDNVSGKVNAYAQDYRDLSSLKKIADNHGICIFLVHHTRKDRDSSNIFNDMTGSTGIMGVADTVMILRKEERFGDAAALCITGRDVEEKKLKMQMCGVRWEITEELNADDLRRERIPDFVYEVVEFLFEHSKFQGTATELLAAVGNTELKPNIASKYLTRYLIVNDVTLHAFIASFGIHLFIELIIPIKRCHINCEINVGCHYFVSIHCVIGRCHAQITSYIHPVGSRVYAFGYLYISEFQCSLIFHGFTPCGICFVDFFGFICYRIKI